MARLATLTETPDPSAMVVKDGHATFIFRSENPRASAIATSAEAGGKTCVRATA